MLAPETFPAISAFASKYSPSRTTAVSGLKSSSFASLHFVQGSTLRTFAAGRASTPRPRLRAGAGGKAAAGLLFGAIHTFLSILNTSDLWGPRTFRLALFALYISRFSHASSFLWKVLAFFPSNGFDWPLLFLFL